MDFKHFSHGHGLDFHEMPQGSKGQCSGCKSPVSGKIYACWQCNHFLHEQCFHATRSLKHPSHPLHPLTLVANPTYQSSSFQCQSCNLIGNGLSYTCAECQFDMHVHCALSPNQNLHGSSLAVPNDTQNYNYNPQSPIHSNTQHAPPHQYNPHNNTQNFIAHHPNSSHSTISVGPRGSTNQHSSFRGPYPQPNTPIPNYSISSNSPYTNRPTNPTLMVNHTTTGATNPPPPLPPPFIPVPNQTRQGTAPIPPSMPPPFHPTINQTPQSEGLVNQNNSFPPNYHNVNTSMPHYSSPSSIPFTNPPIQPTATIPNLSGVVNPADTTTTNAWSPLTIRHFSHRHALQTIELGMDAQKICSACECYLSSTTYICTEPHCSFNLHKACFDSPVELLHTSHHHPLKLVTSPPYIGGFTCDACCQGGKVFVYTCAICSYDLHIDCISWPEKMNVPYHEHGLTLYYSSTSAQEHHDETLFCDTCNSHGNESTWIYYCRQCNFGRHLECVACEVKPERVSVVSEMERLQSARLQGLIAKQTQEFILDLWDDKPKKKKTTYEYVW